eukprot:1043707-Rhodomonas_salina.1
MHMPSSDLGRLPGGGRPACGKGEGGGGESVGPGHVWDSGRGGGGWRGREHADAEPEEGRWPGAGHTPQPAQQSPDDEDEAIA